MEVENNSFEELLEELAKVLLFMLFEIEGINKKDIIIGNIKIKRIIK